jgi:hypothetical protein
MLQGDQNKEFTTSIYMVPFVKCDAKYELNGSTQRKS